MTTEPYFLFFHKHPTSAKTTFLCFSYDSVIGFEPLPALSQLVDADPTDKVSAHPAMCVNAAAARLGVAPDALEYEPDLHCAIETAATTRPVVMLRFNGYDLPMEMLKRLQARFIAITQARGLAPVDIELLRKAYEVILG